MCMPEISFRRRGPAAVLAAGDEDDVDSLGGDASGQRLADAFAGSGDQRPRTIARGVPRAEAIRAQLDRRGLVPHVESSNVVWLPRRVSAVNVAPGGPGPVLRQGWQNDAPWPLPDSTRPAGIENT